MDPVGICMVTVPIFAPIVESLGYDLVWFGVMFVVNMEMACITPPLGMNLFVMRGIAPTSVSMGDIIRGAMPFVAIEMVALVLIVLFPEIILWLPSTMTM